MSEEHRYPRRQDPQKEDDSTLQTDDTNGAGFTSRFFDEFEHLSCLGKGGFGVVFKVNSKIDGRDYAIKRIALKNNKDSRERVMREVKALAKLDHYNIVRYFSAWLERPPIGWEEERDQQWINGQISNPSFIESTFESESATDHTEEGYSVHESHSGIEIKGDVSEHSESSSSELIMTRGRNCDANLGDKSRTVEENVMKMFLYIQMQFCEGPNLGKWLRENKSRDSYLCIFEIFEPIVNAVKYIHIEHIIHRDLKPPNIFFAHGEVKIGDFGLATAMPVECKKVMPYNDLSETKNYPSRLHTAGVGTHLYMSPEQMAGQVYDYKVDIYSLGIIFYELLVPFSTEMERNVVLTDLRQSLIPLDFSRKYPAECDLLKMMLDKNPHKRPTTCEIKKTLKTWSQRG